MPQDVPLTEGLAADRALNWLIVQHDGKRLIEVMEKVLPLLILG